jgi:NAD kinase
MITPICAHSLTGRSIIFDESAEITFRLVDRNGTDRDGRGIWCDGDFGINLTADDEIKVRASEEMAVLVRTDRCGFVQRLRQKM